MDKFAQRKAHNQSQFYRVRLISSITMVETDSVKIFRVGISVDGYADPQVGPWIFQIDDEPPEVLSIEANITCKIIKDHQGLRNGKHLVTVTPLANTFVLTKFRYVYSSSKGGWIMTSLSVSRKMSTRQSCQGLLVLFLISFCFSFLCSLSFSNVL